MGRYINTVQLLGNLGGDPEVRNFTNGGRVLTFSVATAEQWKDRNSGERREKTTWHRVAIFADGLIDIAEQYLKKGSRVLVEGKLAYNDYTDQEGVKRTSAQIELRPFAGEMTLLDGPPANQSSAPSAPAVPTRQARKARAKADATSGGLPADHDLDDEIPF